MKKVTTVLFAMLLLTLSVLAAHADQEGNARWCNIDSHGCYLNEEGGAKSYMHFWSVESCKYFMGNDDPCRNVVARYDKDLYRMPLEPAPEPVVYKAIPKVKPITIEEILEEMTEEEIRELLEEVLPEEYEEYIETVVEYRTIPVTLVQILSNEQALDIMFPQGVVEFNGVMIVTNLDDLQEEGNQRLVSLEAAGSSKEVLIPVYLPKEGFSEEDFRRNFDDHRPITAELSERGKTALLNGSNAKNSFLIPYETEGEESEEMNSNLKNTLKENFVLAGYVSSAGVGVVPQEDRTMEAKNIGGGDEKGGDEENGDSGSGSKETNVYNALQFAKKVFNPNAETKSLISDKHQAEPGKEKSPEIPVPSQNLLSSKHFNAMLMRAMGIFQTENTYIVNGPSNNDNTVQKEVFDSGSRNLLDSKLFFSSAKLESGANIGGLIEINRDGIPGLEAPSYSDNNMVIKLGANTLLVTDYIEMGKALPGTVIDENQANKWINGSTNTSGSPSQVIIDEYKNGNHQDSPLIWNKEGNDENLVTGNQNFLFDMGGGKGEGIHLYEEELADENYVLKFGSLTLGHF